MLLNHRQRQYACLLLSLPDQHPAKDILPISLRKGDGGFQPGELPENNLMWTENARPALYGQWLAWQITIMGRGIVDFGPDSRVSEFPNIKKM